MVYMDVAGVFAELIEHLLEFLSKYNELHECLKLSRGRNLPVVFMIQYAVEFRELLLTTGF